MEARLNVLEHRGGSLLAVTSFEWLALPTNKPTAPTQDASRARAAFERGYNHVLRYQPGKALGEFRKVIKLDPDFGEAYLNLGWALRALGRDDEVISVYNQLLDRFEATEEQGPRELLVVALFLKGSVIEKQGRWDEATAIFDKAIVISDELLSRFGTFKTEFPLSRSIAGALYKKGYALGYSDNAISIYNEVVDRFGTATEMQLREYVARSLVSKGAVLSRLDRHDDAILAYDDVLERFGSSPELPLRLSSIGALFSKAVTLQNIGRSDEAITTYDEVLDRASMADELPLRRKVAETFVNKGFTLAKLGRYNDAFAAYDELLAQSDELLAQSDATNEYCFHDPVSKAYFFKADALDDLGRFREAAANLRQSIELEFDTAKKEELEKLILDLLKKDDESNTGIENAEPRSYSGEDLSKNNSGLNGNMDDAARAVFKPAADLLGLPVELLWEAGLKARAEAKAAAHVVAARAKEKPRPAPTVQASAASPFGNVATLRRKRGYTKWNWSEAELSDPKRFEEATEIVTAYKREAAADKAFTDDEVKAYRAANSFLATVERRRNGIGPRKPRAQPGNITGRALTRT